jgi:predicted GNAT family acetyltransferase
MERKSKERAKEVVDEHMNLEVFLAIHGAWEEVRKEFREELREKGVKRARLPRLAILYDIDGALAFYHVKTNTIVVSAKKVEEAAKKHGLDVRCIAKSVLYHELAHYFYTLRNVFKDYDSEEKEAEAWEFAALAMCE